MLSTDRNLNERLSTTLKMPLTSCTTPFKGSEMQADYLIIKTK